MSPNADGTVEPGESTFQRVWLEWDDKRSEVDEVKDIDKPFVDHIHDLKEEANTVAFTDQPEHLSPWVVAQQFIDMVDRSLEAERLQTNRPFTDMLDTFDGVRWFIDNKFRKLLEQPRQPEVPQDLVSYAKGREDGYEQMRGELAHNLLKAYMFERIEDGQDPAVVAIEEAVKLGYLTEDPDNSEQYVLTLLGIEQAKRIGDHKMVMEMVRGWWDDAVHTSEDSGEEEEQEPASFTDGEGSVWARTENGMYWCGDNPNNEQGGYTFKEACARFGIETTEENICSLEGCPHTYPHYHRGDDEVVRTDPLASMIAETQEEAESEASQQAIVQQQIKEDQ